MEIKIKEGDTIYIDDSGIISDFSKHFYDNKDIIPDNRSVLYLFRNLFNLHK